MWYFPNAVVAGMLNSTGFAESLGASPKLRIYSGTMPVNADAALSGNTQLAELVMAATPIASYSDTGTAARGTLGTIAPDSSADATGTATFFRIFDSAGTTIKGQGEAGLAASGKELILNTTSLTLGSQVSISSGTIDLPE